MYKTVNRFWLIAFLLTIVPCFHVHTMEDPRKNQIKQISLLNFERFLVKTNRQDFLRNKNSVLEVLLSFYSALPTNEKTKSRGAQVIKHHLGISIIEASDLLASLTNNQVIIFVDWQQARRYFKQSFGNESIPCIDLKEASKYYLARLSASQAAFQEGAQNNEDKQTEESEEIEYYVFEYEGETDAEPVIEFMSAAELNFQPKPNTSKQPDQKRDSSSSTVNKTGPSASPSRQPDQLPIKVAGGAGMPVGKKREWRWHNCPNKILKDCEPKNNEGIRCLWIGCLDTIKPKKIDLSKIRYVWILIHGTLGHRTPSFHDETNDILKQFKLILR